MSEEKEVILIEFPLEIDADLLPKLKERDWLRVD